MNTISPGLSITKCLADSLRVWIRYLPALSIASALAIGVSVGTGTLLLGCLHAGLIVMLLKGMRGETPRVGDAFSCLRLFLRFLGITLLVTVLVTVGLILLVVPGILFAVWCSYVYILAADQNMSLDEAFVESRKAVQRHGFWKHFLLLLGALFIAGGSAVVANEYVSSYVTALVWVVPVALLPLALGLLVSAYRQTLEVEARANVLYHEKFEEMRDELQTARDMQMGLLPESGPELEGYSLHGACIPANTVGGDYFAYRWLDSEQRLLAIVVADVSGKAMEAAVTGLRFNEMLRYECRGRTDPGKILDGLDASLEGQIDDSTFITCCIGVLDVQTGEAAVSSAGHCPPYRFDSASGEVTPLELTGFPLGLSPVVRPDEPYREVQIRLNPGDTLVLYSDGVIEAHNAMGDQYEEPRLESLLSAVAAGADAARVVRAVMRDVDRFIGEAPRTDDVTAVVLKRMEGNT